MKINTIKSPFNYHRCTGQQDWVHPYFVYLSPPPTSSNLHSAKLRPPTEDPPPPPADWGNHCFSFYFQWIWLLYVLSMNVIVQLFSAVIGWHLAQSAEVLHVVCISVSVPSGVPKLAFRLSALSAWATALHILGFTFWLTCFFIVCTLHTLLIPPLPVGVWVATNLNDCKSFWYENDCAHVFFRPCF